MQVGNQLPIPQEDAHQSPVPARATCASNDLVCCGRKGLCNSRLAGFRVVVAVAELRYSEVTPHIGAEVCRRRRVVLIALCGLQDQAGLEGKGFFSRACTDINVE